MNHMFLYFLLLTIAFAPLTIIVKGLYQLPLFAAVILLPIIIKGGKK